MQNLDVAPTLLDYLGLPFPEWMSGQSLLGEELDSPQYIFSASVDASLIEIAKEGYWITDAERRTPPFYQLGYVGLIACDRWFELYLQEPALLYGAVDGHTGSCASASLPSPEQAREILLEHLAQNGYDPSGFPDSVPVQSWP